MPRPRTGPSPTAVRRSAAYSTIVPRLPFSLVRALRATIACALVLVQSGAIGGEICRDDHTGSGHSSHAVAADDHATGVDHENHAQSSEAACTAEADNPCAPSPDGGGQCRTMMTCGTPALGGHLHAAIDMRDASALPSTIPGLLESASRSPEP